MAEVTPHVALITGGGVGLGRALALRLARSGASVAVTWREDEGRALATCEEISSLGGGACAVRLDLGDLTTIGPALAATEEQLGPVDILLNNAAIRPHATLDELTPEGWDEVLGVNLRGPFFLSLAVLPHMRRAGFGRIVFIGGIDAYWGRPGRAHVIVSKLAVVGAARALANEVAGDGDITVNTVVPGPLEGKPGRSDDEIAVWRERLPQGRQGRVDEVAATCAFLVSEGASAITGQEIFASGGAMPLLRFP